MRAIFVATLTSASVFGAYSAGATSITVLPVRIELPANGQAEVVRVQNLASEPVLVKVTAARWEDDQDDPHGADPILAVPPIFEVGAAREQVIRLARRQPLNGAKEEAYRLIVSEVPKDEEIEPGAVRLVLRLNFPMFVTPEGALPDPEWALQKAPNGEGELVLANAGTAHVRIEKLELAAEARLEPVFADEGVTYALAGESVTWSLGHSFDALPPALEVRAETNRGPLVAPVGRSRD